MNKLRLTFTAIAGVLSASFTVSCASHPSDLPPLVVGDVNAAGVEPYPLDTCLVIDRKLGSTKRTFTRVYKGKEIKFCCPACVRAFEAYPDPWMAKLERESQILSDSPSR